MAAVASDRTAQYGYTGLAPAGSQAEYQSQPHNLGLPQGLARNNASDGGPIAPLNTNQAKLSSSPRPGLPPVKTPLAITPTYIRHSSIETTLILTRKLPTKYTVITKEREPIFHIDTEELSVHNTKTVYDAKLDTMQFQIKERQSTSETQMYVKLHDSDARVMNVGKEKQGMYLGTFDNVAIVGRGGKLVGIGEECIYVKDDKTEGWGTTGQSIIRNKANGKLIHNCALRHKCEPANS